jgi:hypothetical protein
MFLKVVTFIQKTINIPISFMYKRHLHTTACDLRRGLAGNSTGLEGNTM